MKMRISVLIILFTATLSSVLGHPLRSKGDPFREMVSTRKVGLPEVRTVKLDPNTRLEELRGEAALLHLKAQKAKRKSAFDKVEASLLSRGFRPTNVVYVERRVKLNRTKNTGKARAGIVRADYSESSAEGEVILWSWSDGYDGTWEGVIFIDIYGSGNCTGEGQLNIETEDPHWYYTSVSSSEDYGGPVDKQAGIQNHSPTLIASVVPVSGSPYLLAKTWNDILMDWSYCVRGACTAAAVGCIRSNGGWAACWGTWCSGGMVGCAISSR